VMDRNDAGNLVLAELADHAARVAVRLSAEPKADLAQTSGRRRRGSALINNKLLRFLPLIDLGRAINASYGDSQKTIFSCSDPALCP